MESVDTTIAMIRIINQQTMAKIGNFASVACLSMDETHIACYHKCELLLQGEIFSFFKYHLYLHILTTILEDIGIDVSDI